MGPCVRRDDSLKRNAKIENVSARKAYKIPYAITLPLCGRGISSYALRFVASVRAAITSASTSSADASRNGAPGNFSGAESPMK
jgi:hypothetical protein